jgi:small-conductance mechanosensitive channel
MKRDRPTGIKPPPNRRSGLKYRSSLWVLVMLVILFLTSARLTVAGEKLDPAAESSSDLFRRKPLGFDYQTFDSIAAAFENSPFEVPQLIEFVRAQRRALGHGGSFLMLLLAVTIGYGIRVRAKLRLRIQQALAPLSDWMPAALQKWPATMAELIAVSVLPLSLWALWSFVRALTNFHGPLFIFVGLLLAAWTVYSLVLGALRNLLIRPLLPIPPEHGRYLFRFLRLLLAYAIAARVCTSLIDVFGAPADVVALIDAALRLSLIVLLAIVATRRRAVVALLPDAPNFLYRGFVAGFTRFYSALWVLTVAIALIQLAGFVTIANFLWVRTWLPIGIFLLAVMVNHFSERALRSCIFSDSPPHDNAVKLYRSLARLIRYAIILATLTSFTHLIGAFHPVYSLASRPVIILGNQNVSIVVLLRATLIVALFWLAATLIRDYCEFRIYPRHNIDPGVANAINTFIVYAIVAIGVLASVEAVGLGMGTITLFAGALGIGVGMGLQSMANNLTSGLTLIFTRALRKGDVVTTGDTLGIIQEVGIRATRIKTPDAIEYLVPNSEFVDDKLINWTRSDPYTRVHVPIGVSYDSAPEVVRRIMEEVAISTPNVQPAPPPEVRFANLGDSSLNFELLLWINVKEIQPEKVRSDLYFGLFRALKEAGIEIPFPQRDIHIRSSEVAMLEHKRG